MLWMDQREMGIDIYGSCSVPLLRWTTKRRMEVVQGLTRFKCGERVAEMFQTAFKHSKMASKVGSKDSRAHWVSDNLSLSFFQVEGTIG